MHKSWSLSSAEPWQVFHTSGIKVKYIDQHKNALISLKIYAGSFIIHVMSNTHNSIKNALCGSWQKEGMFGKELQEQRGTRIVKEGKVRNNSQLPWNKKPIHFIISWKFWRESKLMSTINTSPSAFPSTIIWGRGSSPSVMRKALNKEKMLHVPISYIQCNSKPTTKQHQNNWLNVN